MIRYLGKHSFRLLESIGPILVINLERIILIIAADKFSPLDGKISKR